MFYLPLQNRERTQILAYSSLHLECFYHTVFHYQPITIWTVITPSSLTWRNCIFLVKANALVHHISYSPCHLLRDLLSLAFLFSFIGFFPWHVIMIKFLLKPSFQLDTLFQPAFSLLPLIAKLLERLFYTCYHHVHSSHSLLSPM